jgi:hypothetical protein
MALSTHDVGTGGPFAVLSASRFLLYKPTAPTRPTLTMDEKTVALIQWRALDTRGLYTAFHSRMAEEGYSRMDAIAVDEKAMKLRDSGLSILTPEGLDLIRNPTDAEWELTLASLDRDYEDRVAESVADALQAAPAFQRFTDEERGAQYARGPHPDVWKAITSLLSDSERGRAECIGEGFLRKEEDRMERMERECRDYY